MAIRNAARFCNLVNSEPISPLTKDFLGQMFSIPIRSKDPLQLHQLLFETYKIEIPVTVQNGEWYLRYSIQAFNSAQDLDVLEVALLSIKKQGLLL
jgi:isopenicillin-N epimerase